MKANSSLLQRNCSFLEHLKREGAVHKLCNTIRGEGVNPCVTLWSDGRVKLSFWHYRGGEVNFGPKWRYVILNDPEVRTVRARIRHIRILNPFGYRKSSNDFSKNNLDHLYVYTNTGFHSKYLYQ